MRKNQIRRGILAALFLLAGIFTTGVSNAQNAGPEGSISYPVNLYGVSASNQLFRFSSIAPGTVATIGPISGMQSGELVVGIDFRPATGELYAVGSNSRLYTLNKATAAATFVATISTTLSGIEFGVDFNPTVDRIRIVSNTGQNLRVNPVNGAATVDGALNPGSPVVTAAGYTNSFNGAATTTLYVIDTATDTLYTQNPPNNGTLVSVGALGVNATNANGFDIVSTGGSAFAALTVSGTTRLYQLNLTTGAATLAGSIGIGTESFVGLAGDIGSTPNYNVYAVTTANNLIKFSSARPNNILSTVPITGLQSGETIRGIDFRPATGQLFGMTLSRIYIINPANGATALVGQLSSFPTGSNPPDIGFDFNPTVDRIRFNGDTDFNYRLNPNDASISASDTNLAYAPGDVNVGQNPEVVGAAYTNSFLGASSTVLYDIDSNTRSLVIQNPPNNGVLNTVGPIGTIFGDNVGFDIAAGSNKALAALNINFGPNSTLYSIDLATGAGSPIGPIGGPDVVVAMAIGRSTAANAATATIDFDGDGRTDYAVFRPANNSWYINNSSNAGFTITPFGNANTDNFAPGDYDGDGKTDIAMWRTTNGTFYYLRSSDGVVQSFQFGATGDEAAARDYDGDGKTDFAVARRNNGLLTWYINNSATNTVRIEQFGIVGDFTAQGDYDGDGRTDLGVYRAAGGTSPATFYIQQSTAGLKAVQWGLGSDLVVPGDYDGDDKTDFAVLRNAAGFNTFYVWRSADNSYLAQQLGASPTEPVQGDYDGDGRTDFAVWNRTNGAFYVQRSTGPQTLTVFGQNGDFAVASYDVH